MLILWKGDSLMTRTVAVLLAMAILIFGIGIVNVYGEVFTYEPSFEWEFTLCEEFFDGDVPIAQCVIEGVNDSRYTGEQYTVPSGDIIWDDEKKEYVPTEEFEKEAYTFCFNDLECPAGWYQFPNGTTVNFEELIEESQETPDVLPPENVYRCGYDIALYQDGSQFEVPIEIWIDEEGNKSVRLVEDDSIKTDQTTTVQDLAVEACFAQWELEIREQVDVITAVPNVDDYFRYHADVAYGIPPIGQARVNIAENEDRPANLSVHNIICNGSYSYFYQVAEGCEDADYARGYEPAPIRETFPDWMQSDIDQYNRDGGITMAKHLLKEQNTDKLLTQQKQLRALD